MRTNWFLLCCLAMTVATAQEKKLPFARTAQPFLWEASTVYFIVTDRFANGDKTNDHTFNRTAQTGTLRGFEGGDLRGVIQKIDEGYFDKLGVNVLWMTPIVEQIHGGVDEGTGFTYGFHGYWTRDWTAIDPSVGTEKDLAELVQKAHKHGIRIMLDAVINHTGPVTPEDPAYPADWVRTSPKCTYDSYEHFITCTLVDNLPDVKTESNQEVALPPFLIEKWKKEGRYEQEVKELDDFFKSQHLPRYPRHYIMKWLADYIRDYGIDGYRVDTAKHTYENVWAEFKKVCQQTFDEAKKATPKRFLPNATFFMVGEVYGYNIVNKWHYDFGDKKVNYFENGFDGLINFGFPNYAKTDFETLFSTYSTILQQDIKGKTVMNYLSSHDDGNPYDKKREQPFESAEKLLLAPGIAQVYYGDETARSLDIAGTTGDATLRSKMNWSDLATNQATKDIWEHWQKLSQFRKRHFAVGAGVHQLLQAEPYTFARTYQSAKQTDRVVVGLHHAKGKKTIVVKGIFADGSTLKDAYSGQTAVVVAGSVQLDTPYVDVLLEKN